jgi:ADP-heptose:LPS heptosyltransferase
LETYPELIHLFQSISGLTELIKRGGALPACDFMVPIISLAEFFTDNETTIPKSVPYLAPTGVIKPKLAQLPLDAHKKKIGFCAEGKKSHRNNHNRSCDFDTFIKKLQGKDRQLISLQKPAPDLKDYPDIIDASSLCDDFNDMAHIIKQLDLVVTVDTSLAHLAGALNKPVWVLLPYVPDWRWQLERTDSPWYPSMRLFRQDVRGDWKHVLKAVHEALKEEGV